MSSDSDTESEDPHNEEPPECRICYGTSGDKVLDVQVCECTGGMRYICFICLTRVIENQNTQITPVPRCFTCLQPYNYVRYQVGVNGQFRNVVLMLPHHTNPIPTSFREYLALTGDDENLTMDIVMCVVMTVVFIILNLVFWQIRIPVERQGFRIGVTAFFMFLMLCCLIPLILMLYEFIRSYGDYRRYQRKEKRD